MRMTTGRNYCRGLSEIGAALRCATIAVGCSALVANAVSAAQIGVSFDVGNFILSATDSAGVAGFTQTNYNNVGNQGSNSLIDSTGAATAMTLTIPIGPGASALASTASGPNEYLNSGCLFNSVGDISFTLNNIPYSKYTLIVYDLSSTGVVQGITAAGVTYYSSSPNPTGPGYLDHNPATSFLYTQATSTNSATPTALSDYALFSDLTGLTQTVTVQHVPGSQNFIFVGGFEIVDTSVAPEPTTFVLLLSGLVLLGCLRRFTQRGRNATRTDPSRELRFEIALPH